MKPQSRAFIIGAGMTKFLKPSPSNPQESQLAETAIRRALYDAKIDYKNIDAAVGGYVYSEATSAQCVVYRVGMTGIPVYNINNNGATGSSTVHLAYNFIRGGVYECVLAFGFEKMQKGPLGVTKPTKKIYERGVQLNGKENTEPFTVAGFGNAGLQHIKKYGTKQEHFIKIAAKNHRNGSKNPYAQYQKIFSQEQIAKSPRLHPILTLFQCSPTSQGAACIIVCSQDFIKRYKLQNQAVQVLASALATDVQKVYKNNIELAGYSMVKNAAEKVYKDSKINPKEIEVVELHDCFSTNQLITYEALGLCEEGKGGEFVDKKLNDYGGQVVVNPSGGLISRGHPIGATGVSQVVQLVWQLRGIAGERQVFNKSKKLPKYGLQQGIGLGGACVVSLFKKYNENKSEGISDLKEIEKRQNPKPKL